MQSTEKLDIEREYLSLCINKPEALNITQVKSKYLSDKKHQIIFECISECYRKYKCLDVYKLKEINEKFNLDLFIELMTNVMCFTTNWEYHLPVYEENIFNSYKVDNIKILTEKLNKNEITYDEFMGKMKKISDVQLVKTTETLTSEEIINNIADKTSITLNNYPKLNGILQLVQGDFLIVGATTGAGKSGFLLNLMNDLMDNYQCIYFNMEMSKGTIYKRLISIRAEIPINHINDCKSIHQEKVVNQTISELEKKKIVIEHKANDIRQIKSLIAKLKNNEKHTIVFIDHLGLTKSSENKKNLYEQATEVAKELRQICLEYDCTIIGASQLNRGAYNSDDIGLNMLKDSGELENSASKVILLERDKDCDKNSPQINMDIKIAKNRDGMMGVIRMQYDKTKQVFKEKEVF